jgi:hypothetical protein
LVHHHGTLSPLYISSRAIGHPRCSDKLPAHQARGISKALTNDKPGAIADLKIAMTLYKSTHNGTEEEQKQTIDRIQFWIMELNGDRNLFTNNLLKELQQKFKN